MGEITVLYAREEPRGPAHQPIYASRRYAESHGYRSEEGRGKAAKSPGNPFPYPLPSAGLNGLWRRSEKDAAPEAWETHHAWVPIKSLARSSPIFQDASAPARTTTSFFPVAIPSGRRRRRHREQKEPRGKPEHDRQYDPGERTWRDPKGYSRLPMPRLRHGMHHELASRRRACIDRGTWVRLLQYGGASCQADEMEL